MFKVDCVTGSGEIMKEQLGEVSKAEVITNLTNIVHGLNTVRSDLSNIDTLSVKLKDKAIELEQGNKASEG